VLDFVHGRKTNRKVAVKKAKGGDGATETPSIKVDDFGLFRNPPRSLRTEIGRYLRLARGRRRVVR